MPPIPRRARTVYGPRLRPIRETGGTATALDPKPAALAWARFVSSDSSSRRTSLLSADNSATAAARSCSGRVRTACQMRSTSFHRSGVMADGRGPVRELPEEPRACGLPIPLDGLRGNLKHVGRLVDRETAKETQL